MEGWVKIHRKILENPIVCKDAEHFAVWLFLIINATHTELPFVFNGQKIILKKGQLVTCLETIAKKLNVSKSKVNRILKSLKSEKQIETLSKRHGTLITLINWDLYQSTETPLETPVENQWNTSGKPVERNKNNKNNKNIKNDKNKDFIPPTIEEVNSYITEKELNVDGKKFLNYFTESGWVDSKGNKVKNWKLKILTWDGYKQRVVQNGTSGKHSTEATNTSKWGELKGIIHL